nr:ankyrin repeat domain-containing protein [Moraxella catarrhalis]
MSGVEILDALCLGNITLAENLLKQHPQHNLLTVNSDKKNWLHKVTDSMNPDEPPPVTISYLINQGIPINAQDVYGMTPLHYAMRSKNADAAIALLEAGADPNIPNRDNVIPLAMIGMIPKRLDVLELMLKKGGNVHFYNGHYEVLQLLELFWSHDKDYIPVIEMMKQYA